MNIILAVLTILSVALVLSVTVGVVRSSRYSASQRYAVKKLDVTASIILIFSFAVLTPSGFAASYLEAEPLGVSDLMAFLLAIAANACVIAYSIVWWVRYSRLSSKAKPKLQVATNQKDVLHPDGGSMTPQPLQPS